MNGVGDSNVSPYLLQPLRTRDEVEEERARKKPAATSVASTPPAGPAPPSPAPKPESPAADSPDLRPGKRLDTSI